MAGDYGDVGLWVGEGEGLGGWHISMGLWGWHISRVLGGVMGLWQCSTLVSLKS